MARSKIIDPTNDVNKDTGSVLLSFVYGEAIEYPFDIMFIDNPEQYQFTAQVVEANNIADQQEAPDEVKPTAPVKRQLSFRIPAYQGTWSAARTYNRGNTVLYNGNTYELTAGTGYLSALTPIADPLWIQVPKGRMYVRFPGDLPASFSVKPTTTYNTYAFFELAVAEYITQTGFSQVWRPVRGMLEFTYSPTQA